MITVSYIVASIFSPGQLAGIIILAILLAAILGLNIYLAIIWRTKLERKLYDEALQAQRDALLSKLEYMRAGGKAETHTWLSYVVPEQGDDDDNADADADNIDDGDVSLREDPVILGERIDPNGMAEDGSPVRAEVLAVDELSPRVRRKLGLRAKRHNGKKFYVRYKLGFDARLRYSDDETKVRYMELMDDIKSYQGIEIVNGFESQRICINGNTVALILFSGKKLCVALALDPAEYKRTKYRGEDKSGTKRFAKTPMLVRISDDSKVSVVKYLFFKLAADNSLLRGEVKEGKYDLAERTREDLIIAGSVRVIILNDAPATAQTHAELAAAEAAAAEEQAAAAADASVEGEDAQPENQSSEQSATAESAEPTGEGVATESEQAQAADASGETTQRESQSAEQAATAESAQPATAQPNAEQAATSTDGDPNDR